MPDVQRGTVISFDPTTWLAMVLLDGADAEAQIPVGQWVPASWMIAAAEVAVLVFGGTNTDDAVVIGPYGSTGGYLNLGSSVTAATAGQLAGTLADSGTNNVPSLIVLSHTSSATPAAGFGVSTLLRLQSDTTPDLDVVFDTATWVTATHASRKARRTFYVADQSGLHEVMRQEIGASSAAMLGFLGATAVARPTVTGSRGANAALASLLTALANLGLITDSSSP